jgi:hypothetical protein
VALLSCQQLSAGLDKDFGAQDDIGIVGIFVPVMADAANTSAVMSCSDCSSRTMTSRSSSRIWNSISALPGMMLGAPGSSEIRPVVHTVRGPHNAGKRSSIATHSRASASPASLRSFICVVPA